MSSYKVAPSQQLELVTELFGSILVLQAGAVTSSSEKLALFIVQPLIHLTDFISFFCSLWYLWRKSWSNWLRLVRYIINIVNIGPFRNKFSNLYSQCIFRNNLKSSMYYSLCVFTEMQWNHCGSPGLPELHSVQHIC